MRADRGGSESGLGRERERTGAGERGERGGEGWDGGKGGRETAYREEPLCLKWRTDDILCCIRLDAQTN